MTTDDDAALVLRRFFEAVSFQEGRKPAYGTLRGLFLASGRLIATSGRTPDDATLEDFIASRQQVVDRGELTWFQEVEIEGSTSSFGNVAHRLSTYEKSGRRSGEEFRLRGVISTQLVKTTDGWRIASMAWDDERPGLNIASLGSGR